MRFIIIFSLIIKVRLYFLKEETTMNLLKIYENELSTDEILKKNEELKKVGEFSTFFKNKYFRICLDYQFYYGNDYVKDFMKLIKANTEFNKTIENITVDDIVNDENDSEISIKTKDTEIKVDLKNKKVYGYKKKDFCYSDDFVLKPITKTNSNTDAGNAKKSDDSNSKKEEVSKPITIIKKLDNIGKFIDLKDPFSKSIISNFWSSENVRMFKIKINDIMSKIPEIYKEEFKLSKFYTGDKIKVNINDFTLIGKTGKKMHCMLDTKSNKYSCSID